MKRKSATKLTIENLAGAAGVPPSTLWGMANSSGTLFYPPNLQIHKGKERLIYCPKNETKTRFKRLNSFLQNIDCFHEDAHGGIRKRSCFTSARRHLGKKLLITRDIKDCYPSITFRKMHAWLRHYGFNPDVAKLLARLMTVDNQVPQGSPLSTCAINLMLYSMDCKLSAFCTKHNCKYSRNADDIIISTDSFVLEDNIVAAIETEINKFGLVVNESKRAVNGRQPRSKPQLVHGIIVNDGRGTRISHKQRVESLGVAQAYLMLASSATPDQLDDLIKLREKLGGWISQNGQATFSAVKHLRKCRKAGDRIMSKRLRRLGITPVNNVWWSRNAVNGIVSIFAAWHAALQKQNLRSA